MPVGLDLVACVCGAEFREADLIRLEPEILIAVKTGFPLVLRRRRGALERLIWRKEVEAALFQRKTSLVLRQK